MPDSEKYFQKGIPESISFQLEKAEDLRYGENPHQQGARYRLLAEGEAAESNWWDTALRHGGKQLSYLNLNDSEAAWKLACAFSGRRRLQQNKDRAENDAPSRDASHLPAAVVVKHANPCGVALAADIGRAWELAHACDPTSAFGGVVALNSPVDAELAKSIAENFLEVLIAPGYDAPALEVLGKKKNLRVIEAKQAPAASLHFRSINGSLLVQEASPLPDFSELCRELEMLVAGTGSVSGGEPQKSSQMEIVTKRSPSSEEIKNLAFAWVVVAATQSNAIVFAKDQQAVGVGAGQQNRRDAAMLASHKAAERAKGAACASDAFFPFRDGLDQAAEAGCTAVIQPGGSVRDEEVIAAADENGIAMIFTHERRFLH